MFLACSIKSSNLKFLEVVCSNKEYISIDFSSETVEAYDACGDIMISNAAIGTLGNCYAQLGQNDKAAATAALTEAVVAIDKAAAKGIFHKNTAARKVSRLTKAVNTLA